MPSVTAALVVAMASVSSVSMGVMARQQAMTRQNQKSSIHLHSNGEAEMLAGKVAHNKEEVVVEVDSSAVQKKAIVRQASSKVAGTKPGVKTGFSDNSFQRGTNEDAFKPCSSCETCINQKAKQYCTGFEDRNSANDIGYQTWSCIDPTEDTECKKELEEGCLPTPCRTNANLEEAVQGCYSPCVCDTWKEENCDGTFVSQSRVACSAHYSSMDLLEMEGRQSKSQSSKEGELEAVARASLDNSLGGKCID